MDAFSVTSTTSRWSSLELTQICRPAMLGVGPAVNRALRVMRSRRGVASREERVVGRGEVDDVQAAAASVRRDRIGESAPLVNGQVVRRAEVPIEHIGGKGPGRRHVPQAGQVEHLDAVRAGIVGNDVGVVGVDLDVPPDGFIGLRGQSAQEYRGFRVGDVHEGRAVAQSHERELLAGRGIGPAPDVVAAGAAHRVKRHAAGERDAHAREVPGAAVDASRRAGGEAGWRLRRGWRRRRWRWWWWWRRRRRRRRYRRSWWRCGRRTRSSTSATAQ